MPARDSTASPCAAPRARSSQARQCRPRRGRRSRRRRLDSRVRSYRIPPRMKSTLHHHSCCTKSRIVSKASRIFAAGVPAARLSRSRVDAVRLVPCRHRERRPPRTTITAYPSRSRCCAWPSRGGPSSRCPGCTSYDLPRDSSPRACPRSAPRWACGPRTARRDVRALACQGGCAGAAERNPTAARSDTPDARNLKTGTASAESPRRRSGCGRFSSSEVSPS
jgi:hypothetical protein